MIKKDKALLESDELVCGGSSSPLRHWNWVNQQYGLNTLCSEDSLKVVTKYFGKALKIEIPCSKDIFQRCVTEKSNCSFCPLKYNCISIDIKNKPSKQITFADFFCGAGGLSVGFESAGLEPKIANDIDPWFASTYIFNRPKQDIVFSVCSIADWVSDNKNTNWNIDIVSGGVPCQSFSKANRQPKENDDRDNLYFNLIKAAEIINPRVLVIENVGGILKKHDGIIKDLEEHNYIATHVVLNANEYGIPQNRKRVFFIALNKARVTSIEEKIKLIKRTLQQEKVTTSVTLHDAISDLPPLNAHNKRNNTTFNNSRSGFSLTKHSIQNASHYVKKINNDESGPSPLFNHKARYNNERDINIFGILKQGENSTAHSIQHLNPYQSRNHIFKDKYFKLEYEKKCRTITAHMRYDCNMYIHPNQARGLTAREAARVQSFPDDYIFLGNFQRLYQQIGNAVPPLLAKVIASSIKGIL